ncbi:hypothetical protein LH29_10585 [Draconibacterium sediminis]|uniref:Uncharacterized protein n=1 Tax=Draconibacterium sediminis TaxID=1544798 RepID=A0A0D8J9Y8_9BACT|nr:hypothetical protein LH29_10585 [Draconibacterium sediminis]
MQIKLKKFTSVDIGNPKFKEVTKFVKNGFDLTAGGKDFLRANDRLQFTSLKKQETLISF